MKSNNSGLITITLIALLIYNILYWSAKFLGVMPGFYAGVLSHWKLIMFLEFLAVASAGVDVIVRWDKFGFSERRLRLAITTLFFVSFMTRLLFGIIEMYMRGHVE